MSALGELEPLDVAIHSDTGYEHKSTYAFAEKWTPWLQKHGVPLVTTHADSNRLTNIPAFTRIGSRDGQIRRQCTSDWKVRPFRRVVRALLPSHGHAEIWLGISADEFHRARDSGVKYLRNRYPLLELNIDRAGCIAWLTSHGLEVPSKSACVFCPYQNRASFARLKRDGGRDWAVAVAADEEIRNARPLGQLFVHPDRVPLIEAVDIPEDHGYVQTSFDPEGRCDEGVCWV
jgi:hypothetical protein